MGIFEAFKMANTAIMSHKLRSFLTLIGIIAGVASIIAVMTGISVIQSTIESELTILGTTTFQVQKWAAGGPLSEEEARKIMRRKPLTVDHANAIRDKVKSVDLVGAELWTYNHIAKYKNRETNQNLIMCGGTPEYAPNNTHYIYLGRNITNEDIKIGRMIAVIGYGIAQELFPWTDPIEKTIRIDGKKFKVVGVFEEKKSALVGNYDNYILIPVTTFERHYGSRDRRGFENSVNITVNAKSPDLLQDAIAETRAVMRFERNLKPAEEDDFTIFTNDTQIKTFNETTAGIKMAAFIIGIIALIVAGIGIMNIMLVSVTERTKEIGIRKSLGAKRKNIMMQFLLEAIILCNMGGIVGVLVGFALGNIVTIFTGFPVNIPMEWTIGGLTFCTAVGLTFGLWPAMVASKMDPVEALRFE
ncbi:MAG: ABC transporter permease [bacterium]|nr:MAG: ABC transporter permease [bacterium]